MSISCAQTAEITCHRCGAIDPPIVEHGPFGPHAAKAVCPHCGAFVQWVSGKTPEQRQAARQAAIESWRAEQAPTEKQMAYLRKCGMSSRPTNRLDASRLIAVLARGEVLHG